MVHNCPGIIPQALASARGVRRREAVLRETPPSVPWIKKNKLVDQTRN
jgi:hypothetical protein